MGQWGGYRQPILQNQKELNGFRAGWRGAEPNIRSSIDQNFSN
ncbi:hypothetical protein BV133_632 [Blastochloris viridis]|uniref:Uncharacterized protein n=1 Tax=Blastochloris viridis TaxID=1079 RepID=A0A182CYD1_BLAVI|nr:hypothetical protein BV133_632 [Blastochloris viridis]